MIEIENIKIAKLESMLIVRINEDAEDFADDTKLALVQSQNIIIVNGKRTKEKYTLSVNEANRILQKTIEMLPILANQPSVQYAEAELKEAIV